MNDIEKRSFFGETFYSIKDLFDSKVYTGYWVNQARTKVVSTKKFLVGRLMSSIPMKNNKRRWSLNYYGGSYSLTQNDFDSVFKRKGISLEAGKETPKPEPEYQISNKQAENKKFMIFRNDSNTLFSHKFETIEQAKSAAEAYMLQNRSLECTIVEIKSVAKHQGIIWQ